MVLHQPWDFQKKRKGCDSEYGDEGGGDHVASSLIFSSLHSSPTFHHFY